MNQQFLDCQVIFWNLWKDHNHNLETIFDVLNNMFYYLTKYLVLNVTFKVLVLSSQVGCTCHTNVNMFSEVFHRKTSEVLVLLHQVVPTQYK